MAARKHRSGEVVRLVTYLPTDLAAKVERQARRNDRSLAGELRALVRAEMDGRRQRFRTDRTPAFEPDDVDLDEALAMLREQPS